jgi:hypothetical protein
MSLIRVLRWSMAAVIAMGCNSDGISAPLRGLKYSAATATCGPTDGPAVAVYLAMNPIGSIDPTAPFVRVYVPVTLAELEERRVWPVSGRTMATAQFRANESTYEYAATGLLTVTSVDSDSAVSGVVDLLFPKAGYIKTAFRATWIPMRGLCG